MEDPASWQRVDDADGGEEGPQARGVLDEAAFGEGAGLLGGDQQQRHEGQLQEQNPPVARLRQGAQLRHDPGDHHRPGHHHGRHGGEGQTGEAGQQHPHLLRAAPGQHHGSQEHEPAEPDH